MSLPGYETAHLDELDRVTSFQDVTWLPIRRRFGIEAFGANAFAGQAGELVIEEHDETGSGGSGAQEELYVVVTGRATFTIGGEEVDAGAGAFVHIRDPASKRRAVAQDDGTVILALGGTPGQAHEASSWEWTALSIALAAEGKLSEASELLEEGLDRYPDHPALLYNLACYEARAGRAEAALDHLHQAFEGDPKARGWAANDADLDSLRGDPRFASLVAGEPDPGVAGEPA
jgi:tetratricopeptide (TPR) repeat protein